MEGLDQKLKAAYDALQQKERITIHLDNIEERLEKKYSLLHQLNAKIKKGEQRIQDLEATNLRTLLRSVMRNKKEEIEKERQNYHQAFLEFESIEKKIESLQFEKSVLEKKMSQNHKVEQNYRQLIALKSQKLKSTNKIVAKEIFQIEAKIWAHNTKIKETTAAITRGNAAIKLLKKLIRGLKTVQTWNAYEREKNSFAKKKYINKAKDDIFLTDLELEKYEEEVTAIYKQHQFDPTPHVNTFKDFLSDFANDHFSDSVIQSKVENNLNNINQIKDRILNIADILENEIEKTKEYLEHEEEEKRMVILKA